MAKEQRRANAVSEDRSICVDCGIDTCPRTGKREGRWECYMVHKAVWAKAGMEHYGGYLCIGCLERRLGRMLRPRDFTDAWINDPNPWYTERLVSAPLTAEMEIRVPGIADRPPAVMLLEGGYRLVLLLLGHDTSFLHAHGARQDCLLRVGSCPLYGNGLCALQYARRLQSRTHRAPRESVQRERAAERFQATADRA
jgi:hypothetical protein